MAERGSIERVLVANRGEIARRIFGTCRRLALATVAVYSDADSDAPFVQEADEAYHIGGSAPADSYLRPEPMIDAALRSGADAIHPGYGFLSENAAFAQAVLDAGLIWIGPSPAAIGAMGLKTSARERMDAAGVPVLPGRRLTGSEAPGALLSLAHAVGFPLLIKASAGGGGKGMRLVEHPDELADAVDAARREASRAFGDEQVFLERFSARARHVEIQILGDRFGTVLSLGERDCSVQRRHQKVIEESPSPALDAELRQQMSAAAVAAGAALDYASAGTVEFLLAGREFFFLEVNTRLQVEHPVTELVRGIDLVEWQLRVAAGEPLPADLGQAARGSAIEARLYAEDPANGFLPVTGRLTRFAIPGDVRVDTGVRSGSVIAPHYDPMIAKVIAYAPSRREAARRLADALRRAELHGLTTNRDFLVNVLEHPEFLDGRADTSFLEQCGAAELAAATAPGSEVEAAPAAALALQADRRATARTLGSLPSGWRNVPALPQSITFESETGVELIVRYRFDRAGELELLSVNDEELADAQLHACSGELVELTVAGRRRQFRVHSDGPAVYVNTARGQTSLRVLPRHPVSGEDAIAAGSLTAPMPGSVLRVMAAVGERVDLGQPLLVLEAMKMEHEIVAPVAGKVAVSAGTQVQTGTVLAVIDDEGAAR